MLKRYYKCLSLILALAVIFSASVFTGCEQIKNAARNLPLSFSGTKTDNTNKSVPADYLSGTNLAPEKKKNLTVMIYMNGSDLESKYQAATDDLKEIFNSGLDGKNINVIVFTGGTEQWHTKSIPNKINAIFKIEDGKLIKLTELDASPIGYPSVMSGFINFSKALFPADKYGLIFWNHGGGAVVGYGSDERYENDPSRAVMKLSDIDSALANSDMKKKFEFIGFDTCLMSTLEMACIASKYAKYMVASEDLEPDGGWDYNFMGKISSTSTGYEIGKEIVDSYAAYYNQDGFKDILTISLTDLSKVNELRTSLENLAEAAITELENKNFPSVSKARAKNRMFGSRGENGGETDMIDAMQLADSLNSLFPAESAALRDAIENAVVYKYEDNIEGIGGLSVYFPYSNKEGLEYKLQVYKSIQELPVYANFISGFSDILTSEPVIDLNKVQKDEKNKSVILTKQEADYVSEVNYVTWQKVNNLYVQVFYNRSHDIDESGVISVKSEETASFLNGIQVCLYEISSEKGQTFYSIPIKLNGEDADLIAVYENGNPDGKIIGAVPIGEDAFNTLDKKMVQIAKDDIITIMYCAKKAVRSQINLSSKKSWYEGDSFYAGENIKLTTGRTPSGEYMCEIILTDVMQNDYATAFYSLKVEG